MNAAQKLRRLALSHGGLPIVWAALTVLVLFPVWQQRLLPMLDIPNHLALVRGWHNYSDPSYHLADYYELRLRPVPYMLYYLSIHLLMYVAPIEVANKLFLSAYLIAFPLSVLSLARVLRRSPWLALGAFPLAFNQNWIYGFASYLGGTCFMFFSFSALIRYLNDGRRRDLVALGVLSILAYFGHVLAWFCFGVGAIGLLALHWRAWRRVLYTSAVLLPSVILAVAVILQEQGERAYMRTGKGWAGTFRSFPVAVMEFPRRVMELFPGPIDMIVLGLITVSIVWLVIRRGTHAPGETNTQRKQLPLLIVIFALMYLSLPYDVTKPFSWWYISPRIPSILAPLLLLLPAGPLAFRQRLALVPLLVGAIILPLKLGHLYRGFSARNVPFMQLVGELPRGSKTMVVVRGMMPTPPSGENVAEMSGDPATSAPVYWHFTSWPMALHGGYDPYTFNQGVPIRPRVVLRAPEWSQPDRFNIRKAPDFDYYLVKSAPEEMEREPALEIVDHLGDWTLYRRIYTLTDEP